MKNRSKHGLHRAIYGYRGSPGIVNYRAKRKARNKTATESRRGNRK